MVSLDKLIDALELCAEAQETLLTAISEVDAGIKQDLARMKDLEERVTAMEGDFRVLRIKALPILGDAIPPVRIYNWGNKKSSLQH